MNNAFNIGGRGQNHKINSNPKKIKIKFIPIFNR